MPANLPAEAKAKWLEVTLTKNPETKLELMQEFMSLVPKHKGTENLRAQVKRQMAGLRDEIEKKKKQAKTGRAPSYFVKKAGAAQIALIGPPNVGRSSLLKAVTNAQVEIAHYPFSTRKPTPGMLPYEDIQFQIVEIPPIIEGSSEGKADGFQVLSMVRNSDAILLMVDVSHDPKQDLERIQRELENNRIMTVKPPGEVEIQKRGHGRNIQFVWEGELEGCTTDEVISLLREYKIRSALVHIRGKVNLDIVEDAIFSNSIYRPTIVLVNKMDLINDDKILEDFKRKADPLEVIEICAKNPRNLSERVGRELFKLLKITRIYTKEQGEEPASDPIINHGPLTVGDLAKIIHNDFYNNLKYARIWGPSANFPKEKVGLDREIKDGTVIQLYM
ncbi:MAG: GTPase [Candidatus Bathyarchaeia archaeon]